MKKCYVFINRYLGDKQAGIQAAHAIARMMIQPPKEVLRWAVEHETLVLLNGGDHNDLERLMEYNCDETKMFEFREPGLNNAITAVAYVPNEAHENRIDVFKAYQKTGFEYELNTGSNAVTNDYLCDLITRSHSFRG
ncbi:hypothetical protein phiAS5_ORF0048 [Aeromonas phage phiAS5]|uniref:Uncharacterized protein n=1 Tax=Aeromonas phage phiAS5 TaxID=879630 RepID=E1A2E5_9CAUD|nr:hydrolase [Aeromonas phage phiAS5]ADM79891.1 hypothetical protein phiAS5_ORF0048 [Aeromonas phage phiAS5]BES53340.1 hypothetical protein [Aeromonas phage phiWae14]